MALDSAFLAASDLDLLAARNQMAVSLGFHFVFAALGVGFPLITLLAHRRGLRQGDPDALILAHRWSKVMAVLFAEGAVSGTILSFEMGMLWPGLVGTYGDVIGLPSPSRGFPSSRRRSSSPYTSTGGNGCRPNGTTGRCTRSSSPQADRSAMT
jgi:hypothetical protein